MFRIIPFAVTIFLIIMVKICFHLFKVYRGEMGTYYLLYGVTALFLASVCVSFYVANRTFQIAGYKDKYEELSVRATYCDEHHEAYPDELLADIISWNRTITKAKEEQESSVVRAFLPAVDEGVDVIRIEGLKD